MVDLCSASDAPLPQQTNPPRVWQITGDTAPSLAEFDREMASYMEARNISRGSLAVTRNGRLMLSRAYTWAVSNTPPTLPANLYRIASLSKPITSVAVLQLVQAGRLGIDQKISTLLDLTNATDPRFREVTVRQLLQHWGGWDRNASFDPMFEDFRISETLHRALPTSPEMVFDFMKTQPLDSDPGAHYAYSNFGYSLLGRIIERITGVPYDRYVIDHVLEPVGIHDMRVGKSLLANKLPAEVAYEDPLHRKAKSVMGTNALEILPVQYGGWNIATMDSHGGWLASAPDLARFVAAFDIKTNSPLLSTAMIDLMWSRPPGQNPEDASYYGAGWSVRPVHNPPGSLNAWHNGLLDGTFTYMVRLSTGIDWIALFNKSPGAPEEPNYYVIDPEINKVISHISHWPDHDLFKSSQK